MIHGRLDQIIGEVDAGSPLGSGLQWLSKSDLPSLAEGRYEIDGERVFAMVERGETRPVENSRFEIHRRYTDIQMDIVGSESIGWADLSTLEADGEFDSDDDIGFFHRPGTYSLLQMAPGLISIFHPGEAHMTLMHPHSGPTTVTKVIVKVAEGLTG